MKNKITNFKNKNHIWLENNLVWFKKAGRAKAKRNSYAVTKETIKRAYQVIEEAEKSGK